MVETRSLSHLGLIRYRVVTPQTDRRTDRIAIANTRSQQYLLVQLSRVKNRNPTDTMVADFVIRFICLYVCATTKLKTLTNEYEKVVSLNRHILAYIGLYVR